jgi:hypothetical protein
MKHQPAQDRREPGHDNVREGVLFQKPKEPSHKEPGVCPNQGDLVARWEKRQGLLEQLDTAIGWPGLAGSEGAP